MMQLFHILAVLPLVLSLPHVSDTYHPFYQRSHVGALLPRVDTDSDGRPILNYNSKTEPKTVENKLQANGLSDLLDPLPKGEKQFRNDAERYKRKHPGPAGYWLDHADPSSTRQGKGKSMKYENPLAWVPQSEQRQEAKDVSAAVRQARKTGKQIRTKIDGKDPSELRKERSKPATVPTYGAAQVSTSRNKGKRSVLDVLVARALNVLVSHGI